MRTEQQKENLKTWIAALRSGDYQQARQELRRENMYCCLGVLCDISRLNKWVMDVAYAGEGYNYGTNTHLPPQEVIDWCGLSIREEDHCTTLNDLEKASFNEIADYLESIL